MEDTEAWPALPFSAWQDTCETLQLWTQIIGKVRLAHAPWLNHSWHVPLYVTARGLTTSAIFIGAKALELSFDFIDHRLLALVSDGARRELSLQPRSVAEFYARVAAMLDSLGLRTRIGRLPNEIANAIPFDEDTQHCAYDGVYAQRFWRILLRASGVMSEFRTAFLGKCSPVHFFWGSFDLAVTRFSGRSAPPHPGGVPNLSDAVVREAYSHEVSSAGFWPGGNGVDAAFYSYAYPEPQGYRQARVAPDAAFFSTTLNEYLLPYEALRTSSEPNAHLLSFLQTTYEAAAQAGRWDRDTLECAIGRPRVPRPIPSLPA